MRLRKVRATATAAFALAATTSLCAPTEEYLADGDILVTFTESGEYVPKCSGTAEILVVAGGGGGSVEGPLGAILSSGAGGGGGGVLHVEGISIEKGVGINAVVGAGGAGQLQRGGARLLSHGNQCGTEFITCNILLTHHSNPFIFADVI